MDYPPVLKKINLLYVGRIDVNKNIVNLLKRIDEYSYNYINRFTIVGDGPLMNELYSLAKSNPKLRLLGRLNNSESCKVMARNDYLILPSLYDGWGAVVNEALSQGTPVLCSEACGASILLDGSIRGQKFNSDNLDTTVESAIKYYVKDSNRRKVIKNWAKENISGETASKYFYDIISGKNRVAPWISND